MCLKGGDSRLLEAPFQTFPFTCCPFLGCPSVLKADWKKLRGFSSGGGGGGGGVNSNSRKFHLLNWKIVSKSKGGLGIRNLDLLNMA